MAPTTTTPVTTTAPVTATAPVITAAPVTGYTDDGIEYKLAFIDNGGFLSYDDPVELPASFLWGYVRFGASLAVMKVSSYAAPFVTSAMSDEYGCRDPFISPRVGVSRSTKCRDLCRIDEVQ